MEILYHYCSLESFLKIIKKKSLRLSSLLSSNDYNEGIEVINLIKLFLSSNHYPETDKKLILECLSFFSNYFHGIGFCLSEEEDLLSQWRGYATDGAGFAIGFSKIEIEKICRTRQTLGNREFSLVQVQYDEIDSFTTIAPIIKKIKAICGNTKYETRIAGLLTLSPLEHIEELNRQNRVKKQDDLLDALFPICEKLFTIKNNAFLEEKEWRLLATIKGNDFLNIDCFARNDKLVPFDTISFEEFSSDLIKNIIIGPKNQTTEKFLMNWLEQIGYKNFKVAKSKATYR